MIRVLIAYSGGGKSHKIRNEIINKYKSYMFRKIYVIELKEYSEYSDVFNKKFVQVFKPDSDFSFLKNEKNCSIYIDCEDYSDDFFQKVQDILQNAKNVNYDVTITLLRYDESKFIKTVLDYADEVFVGKLGRYNIHKIEERFSVHLREQQSNFDFREIYKNEEGNMQTDIICPEKDYTGEYITQLHIQLRSYKKISTISSVALFLLFIFFIIYN